MELSQTPRGLGRLRGQGGAGDRTGGAAGDSEGDLGQRPPGSRRDGVQGFEARREGRGQGRRGKCHPWPTPRWAVSKASFKPRPQWGHGLPFQSLIPLTVLSLRF